MTRPITKAAKVELAIEDEDGNCCYSYDGDAGDVSFVVPNVSVKFLRKPNARENRASA